MTSILQRAGLTALALAALAFAGAELSVRPATIQQPAGACCYAHQDCGQLTCNFQQTCPYPATPPYKGVCGGKPQQPGNPGNTN